MENFLDSLAKGKNNNIGTKSNYAVIYTRVSSKEQADNNMSLSTQRKACMKHADREGLIIKETFGGTHESAKTDDRPQFKELLEYVKKPSNNISYLLVYSFDRFSRSGINGAQIITELSKLGVEVISVTQPIDASSPAGRLQQNILMIFNEFDNQLRRQKTIEGMKAALERGDWITGLPRGYSKDKNTGKIDINADGYLIQEGFNLFLQGLSISQIVKVIGSKGLKLAKQRWSDILKNPFYCGYISHKLLNGEIVKGNHPAIVSEDVFRRVHEIRQSGNRLAVNKTVNQKYPLKGFLRCLRCDTPMTAYEKKGHVYYKCNRTSCSHNVSANTVNASFQDYLTCFELANSYTEPIVAFLKAEFNHRNEQQHQRKKYVSDMIRILTSKKEKLENKFLYSESVSEDLFNRELKKISNEINELSKEEQKLEFELSNSQEFIDYALEISSNLKKIWINGDYETKVKLQNLIFPEGVSYEKETDIYRTPKTNPLFTEILRISDRVAKKRKGRSTNSSESSSVVAGGGLYKYFIINNL